MRRRELLAAVAGALVCPALLRAASSDVPAVGYLYAGSITDQVIE